MFSLVRISRFASVIGAARPVATIFAMLIAGALAGCGDGASGSSGGGGTGGSTVSGGGGAGGSTTTSTPTPTISACEVGAEPHVAVTIIGPDSKPVGPVAVDVSGTLTGMGIDTPPSPDCGSGQAWIEIQVGVMETWFACVQAPTFQLDVMYGDAVTLVQTVDEHPIAPASIHTTLRDAGNLILHIEQATYEAEVKLPDGVTVAKGDMECDSPDDACKTQGFAVSATVGATSISIAEGASGDVGGYTVYADRYWSESPSTGCDGGDADIRLAVTPTPGI
ncbi:MAG: hypothetical protein U0441_24020 [Polyangiaceae bacterium]